MKKTLKSIIATALTCTLVLGTVCAFPTDYSADFTNGIEVSAAEIEVPKVTIQNDYTCTTNAIRINWNKVTGATGYRVYKLVGDKWVKVKTIQNNDTFTYRDGNCTAGTRYKYKVKAYKKVNGKNYWGKASSVKCTSTRSNKINFTSTTKTTNSVTLKWTKRNSTGYQVYQYKSNKWVKIATLRDPNTLSYKVSGLSADTTYKFKVRAYKTDGKGTVNAGSCTSTTITTKKPSGGNYYIWSNRTVNFNTDYGVLIITVPTYVPNNAVINVYCEEGLYYWNAWDNYGNSWDSIGSTNPGGGDPTI